MISQAQLFDNDMAFMDNWYDRIIALWEGCRITDARWDYVMMSEKQKKDFDEYCKRKGKESVRVKLKGEKL